MKMSGEISLPAARHSVWEKLNDPEVLKDCIPGCESLVREGDGFAAVAKIKVGPITAKFKGRVDLADLDPPSGYRIVGGGEGGLAGFAKGSASVRLTEVSDDECLLSYDVEAVIGGKLAQLGSRLIDSVAKKTADQFFQKFANSFADESKPSL